MKKIQFKRALAYPILRPIPTKEHWWEYASVFNPGAAVYDDKIYLVYRALGNFHYSNFGLAILSEPTKVEERLKLPFLEANENDPFERFGIEDPRIAMIDGEYYITYTAVSIYPGGRQVSKAWQNMDIPWRVRASCVSTKDFIHLKNHGVIMPNVDTKNCALLPGKVGGKYVLIHRVWPDMWISFSSRLNGFDKGEILCRTRKDRWDNARVGAGAAPIRTPLGWLMFYHGADESYKNRSVYHTGILLMDEKDPQRILYRSDYPVFSPEREWEKSGYVRDVVFTSGAIEWDEKYYIYYGAADRRIGVAYLEKSELLDYLSSKI
ncbi:hypothetical protein MUP65_00090 [Patescibacteria group bacterium]|nr:hypothetical protein [Patescibacteria group bacterium]